MRSAGGRRALEGEAVSVRVGIDVGGTFTDLVAIDPGSGAVRSRKVLTTPEAPARGVLAGLQSLAPGAGSIAHGTTIVTNAIVEGRHARTALVTTRGFRDVLEIARQSRQELYRLDLAPRPAPLVPRHLRLEVTERVLADGRVAVALAEDELPAWRRRSARAASRRWPSASCTPTRIRPTRPASGRRSRGRSRSSPCRTRSTRSSGSTSARRRRP